MIIIVNDNFCALRLMPQMLRCLGRASMPVGCSRVEPRVACWNFVKLILLFVILIFGNSCASLSEQRVSAHKITNNMRDMRMKNYGSDSVGMDSYLTKDAQRLVQDNKQCILIYPVHSYARNYIEYALLDADRDLIDILNDFFSKPGSGGGLVFTDSNNIKIHQADGHVIRRFFDDPLNKIPPLDRPEYREKHRNRVIVRPGDVLIFGWYND